MSDPAPDNFAVHAHQLLTMPDQVDALRAYDPGADLIARDALITGLIPDGGVLVERGKIAWIGRWEDRPKAARKKDLPVMTTGVCTPGLIDCHTHAVFGGSRHHEFMARNAGKPYVEILEAGGGILQSVAHTRAESRKSLAESLTARAYDFVRRGVTTIEVKSGYGLSVEDELKCLRAIRDAAAELPCELVACFMGAHAIPQEYRERRADYVALVCDKMLPQVAEQRLADYCDVFCDRGAFTVEEARLILTTAQRLGLKARIHAEEIAHTGAASLAAALGALSADHLEHITPADIDAMARANVVGVLMPAVNLYLGTLDTLAPARALLNAGCEIALSTDFNPGSAMTQDLGWILTLGCTLYKLTPGEALRAVTLGAARALGREDLGRLRVGQTAQLTLFDAPDLAAIPYHAGASLVEGVVWGGQFVYWTEADAL